jgi:nucleoside-diphosphate-sugar epimerase
MIDLSGKTALVTGASGFIGAAVARRLADSGAIVHGVSRSQRTGGACGRWWRTDLTDVVQVRRLLDAVVPDFVFHFSSTVSGGRDLDLVLPTLQANLVTSVNLLTATAGNARVRILFAGSQEEPQPDGTWPVPCSPYAAAKLAAGAYARMFHAVFGSSAVWLRLFMVYGPAQSDTRKLVPYVTQSLLRGEAPSLSSGTRRADWIFIDDVADAFLAAVVASGVEGRTIDIGSGKLLSVRAVVELLARIIGTDVSPRFGALPDRPLEVEPVADVAVAAACLGWQARTSLADGLRQTVEWYRGQGAALIFITLWFTFSFGEIL